MLELITELIHNGQLQDFAIYVAAIWGTLLSLFKTPAGKKILHKGLEEGTKYAKEELGSNELTGKVDSLSQFTRKHLENGDDTPMVERMKKQGEAITALQEYVTTPR